MPPAILARLRKLALSLPEAHEVVAWGEPPFRVMNKLFTKYGSAGTHHGNGRNGVWLDAGTDRAELAGLLEDGYRMTAPKRVLAAAQRPAVGPPAWRPPARKRPKR